MLVTALIQRVIGLIEKGVEPAAAVLGAGRADTDFKARQAFVGLHLDAGGERTQPFRHVQGVVEIGVRQYQQKLRTVDAAEQIAFADFIANAFRKNP